VFSRVWYFNFEKSRGNCGVKISRREFLILTAGFAAAGCQSAGKVAVHRDETVNAGAVGHYAADGVYPNFRHRGFFIVRQGEKLFALSAICTHSFCRLIAEPDRSYYCKCHGSTFAPDGKVTHGPAKRDLPVLPFKISVAGDLIVTVPAA
jgi:Rieske Fe-S protein